MRYIPAIVLCALLAACTSPHPLAVTQAHGHEVALYLNPAAAGESNDLRIEVRGAAIPQLTGVVLSMPGMGMPPAQVPLIDNGTGSYDAPSVRFSMAGGWHVSVLERDVQGTHEFTAFDVAVR